jgi:hypothetical protein
MRAPIALVAALTAGSLPAGPPTPFPKPPVDDWLISNSGYDTSSWGVSDAPYRTGKRQAGTGQGKWKRNAKRRQAEASRRRNRKVKA